MAEQRLAAVQLLDGNDPTLLTYAEIRDTYGTPLNFFFAFGLKPWNADDCEEARAISRGMKENFQGEPEDSRPETTQAPSSRKKTIQSKTKK
jgi:hypothetical protein